MNRAGASSPGTGDTSYMASHPPQITTIIPTFRRPRLLRRALRSVLSQSYSNFRVCIYDNASGDETAAVVAEMAKGDSRVQYHCHPENIGACPNFLYGVERVETPYFSFLSDDDLLLPDFYQNVMEGFQKFPEAAYSALATIGIFPRDRVAVIPSRGWQPGLYLPPEGLRKMLQIGQPLWPSVVFRRELIDQLDLCGAEIEYPLDASYNYRTAARFPIVISLQPGGLLMVHAESASVRGPQPGDWPYWMKMIGNLTSDDKIPLDVRDLAKHVLTKRLIGVLFVDCGLRAIIAGRCEEGRNTAEFLAKEFGEQQKAATLRRLARVQLAFPFCGRLISLAVAARKMLRRIWDAEYRQQGKLYLEYEKFLNDF